MPTTPSYDTTLADQHARAAELAATLSRRILTDGPSPAAFELLHAAAHERDALAQQIAWRARGAGWCWPTEPAWTD